MAIDTKCGNCGKKFALDAAQEKFFAAAKARGQAFFVFPCPHCGLDTTLTPEAAGKASGKSAKPAKAAQDAPEAPNYRCPVPACAGWVDYLEGKKPCWGCGECGSKWFDRKNLFKEITAITAKYAYRKKSYRKDGDGWLPQPLSKEDPDYEEKVEGEPMEKAKKSFIRG